MSDELRMSNDILPALRQSGEAASKIADNEILFNRAFNAYRNLDIVDFHAALEEAGLLAHCRVICRWFCVKYCTLLCRKLCGSMVKQEADVEDFRQYVDIAGRLFQDEAILKRLVEILQREDVEAWRNTIAELQLQPYCYWLCRWLCIVRCRRSCWILCSSID